MQNIKLIYPKNKGFTLIEIILTLAISSIIVLTLYSILSISSKASILGEEKDELMLNGRYAIEFIKGEIKWADKVILGSKIEGLKQRYPKNIGFIIMTKVLDNKDEDKIVGYRYITYYLNGNTLVRLSWNLTKERYPTMLDLVGRNDICEFVDSIEETTFDIKNSLISLNFKFKHHSGERLDLNTDIYIRCPVDY